MSFAVGKTAAAIGIGLLGGFGILTFQRFGLLTGSTPAHVRRFSIYVCCQDVWLGLVGSYLLGGRAV